MALLILLGLAWLLILTALVLDLAGIRRSRWTGWRWFAVGSVVCMGTMITDAYSDYRGWPYDEFRHSLTSRIQLAGVIIMWIGIVAGIRRGRRKRRAR
jgi:uncharacterized membrane protein